MVNPLILIVLRAIIPPIAVIRRLTHGFLTLITLPHLVYLVKMG
ncbi:hypothetical protein PgNI_06646 [Pyricularia grisea]|uniref:Uncharacterized protein n=1 Tax=Pyricularia grisea TaxID=148305 RepID=A0A6P8B620_PYRGI|nr:hypothetical protein PgNI_06646 [Pyricularia grisea]TLD10752.1 hypothetical protein PgNI_06646 [Pyricularia grisea]